VKKQINDQLNNQVKVKWLKTSISVVKRTLRANRKVQHP